MPHGPPARLPPCGATGRSGGAGLQVASGNRPCIPGPGGVKQHGLLLAALGVVLVGAVAGGLSAQPPGGFGDLTRAEAIRYITWAGVAGAAYATGLWLVLRRPSKGGALAAILVAGLAARLLVLGAAPVLSTDIYRYVWDGRVQAAGINPYLYLPVEPALAPLRDPGTGAGAVFPNINRADTAPTIYPPAAQALFGLTGLLGGGIWTMKGVMLAFDAATAGLLLLLLRTAGRPAAQVLVWAWNPLVIWEFAGAGHIDAMALTFIALALLLAARSRAGWAGLALGVAVLTKLLPAALFPAFWRRWNVRTPLAAGLAVAAGYAAYSSAGWKVLGYLGGYAQEEQLQDGGGFLLLRLAALAGPLPGWAGTAYAAGGLALLGAVALWVVRRPLPLPRPARVEALCQGVLLLSGTLIAVISPHYPWYLTMLVLPAAVRPSLAALWPTVAGPLLYLDFARSDVLWPALVYIPCLALLLAAPLRRRLLPAALPTQGGP